jgi:hypothetical protein
MDCNGKGAMRRGKRCPALPSIEPSSVAEYVVGRPKSDLGGELLWIREGALLECQELHAIYAEAWAKYQ